MNKLARLLVVPLALLAAVVLHAPPASAAIYEYQGWFCNGTKLVRCGWVNLDSTNNQVRAYGRAWDTTSARVIVDLHVCLQWRTGPGAPAEMGDCGEYISDPEVTNAWNDTTRCYNSRQYRAYVFWVWDPPGAAVERGQHHSSWVAPNVC